MVIFSSCIASRLPVSSDQHKAHTQHEILKKAYQNTISGYRQMQEKATSMHHLSHLGLSSAICAARTRRDSIHFHHQKHHEHVSSLCSLAGKASTAFRDPKGRMHHSQIEKDIGSPRNPTPRNLRADKRSPRSNARRS
jgi:hypothetical protein